MSEKWNWWETSQLQPLPQISHQSYDNTIPVVLSDYQLWSTGNSWWCVVERRDTGIIYFNLPLYLSTTHRHLLTTRADNLLLLMVKSKVSVVIASLSSGFLSDPGPIIVYPCQSLTDSLTRSLVKDWTNWPKFADYADYAETYQTKPTKPNIPN